MLRKFIYFWAVGLAVSLELGLEGLKPSELKEIEKEIAAGNLPPNFPVEKPKRLVPKLTNTDSSNFNHLSSGANKPSNAYNIASQTSFNPSQANYASLAPAFGAAQSAYSTAQSAYSAAQNAYNPAQSAYNPAQLAAYSSPLRFLQGSQYFPSNQFLPYLQSPQIASQLASQLQAFQANSPHYLQTPTQIQYVSPPSFQQVPSAQFKALATKTPNTAAVATQPLTASQPSSQVVLPSNMYTMYPQHQSYLMLLVQPQQNQLLYPSQQSLLLAAQNPLLQQLYSNQHRFAFPYASPLAASQLNYFAGQAGLQQQQQSALSNTSEDVQTQSSPDASTNTVYSNRKP